MKERIQTLFNHPDIQVYLSKEFSSKPKHKPYTPKESTFDRLMDGSYYEYSFLPFVSPFFSMHYNVLDRTIEVYKRVKSHLPFSKKEKERMEPETKEKVAEATVTGWMSELDHHRKELFNSTVSQYFRNDYETKKIKLMLKESNPIIFEEEEYEKIKNALSAFLKNLIIKILEGKEAEETTGCLFEFWKECLIVQPFGGIELQELGRYYVRSLNEPLSKEERSRFKKLKRNPIQFIIPNDVPLTAQGENRLLHLTQNIEGVKQLIPRETFLQLADIMIKCGEELAEGKKEGTAQVIEIVKYIPLLSNMLN